MAGFFVVMSRFENTSQATLLVPANSRTHRFESTAGLFVNTLLCAAQVDEHLSVAGFIRIVATQFLECQQHARYPFDHIWSDCSTGVPGLACGAMFNYVDHCCLSISPHLDRLTMNPLHGKFELSMDVVRTGADDLEI